MAVDLENGDEIWSYPIGGSASPAVADGVVYIGSDDGAIYAIDAAKGGDPIWLFATGSAGVQSPIVAGDAGDFHCRRHHYQPEPPDR